VPVPETDEELVRRARAGDAEAFGGLIERHQKTVASFLLSMFHDPDAAEDAAQEAFLKAFRGLGRFEGRSSFKTWVSRIALNEARSRLRWAKLRSWLSLDAPRGDDDGSSWEERLRSARPGPAEDEELEKKLDLERAMAALSPREREIAALRLEGYSLGEIAQSLEVSEGTVKSTLFSATHKMRKRLS
jgi:RNA polymerase sigma-70 factor (ECF subfamily)